MEVTENKIIASKLDELKTLPKDYQPNLDSKWALLEASLSGKDKSKQRAAIWMRSAAAVIIFGLVGFWIQSEYQVKDFADTKTKAVIESQPADEAGSTTKTQAALRVQNELNVADKFTVAKTSVKNAMSEEKIIHVIEPLKESAALAVTNVVEDSVTSTFEEPTQIAAASALPINKKKSRYVQLDFDDSVGESPLNPPEQTMFVKNFRISLLKSHDTRSINPATPPEALFKINF